MVVAVGTLLVFTAIHVRLVALGFTHDCGCFGESNRRPAPWKLPARNAALIALLMSSLPLSRWPVAGHALIGASVGVLLMLALIARYRRRERYFVRAWQLDT